MREFLLGKEEAGLSKVPVVATATMARLPPEAAKSVMALHPRYAVAFHPEGTFLWVGGRLIIHICGD